MSAVAGERRRGLDGDSFLVARDDFADFAFLLLFVVLEVFFAMR